MNVWESPEISRVTATLKKQEDYNTFQSLIFGILMSWFFLLLFWGLQNFAFQAYLERYLPHVIRNAIFFFGYFICFILSLLAARAYYIYFRKPRDIKMVPKIRSPYSTLKLPGFWSTFHNFQDSGILEQKEGSIYSSRSSLDNSGSSTKNDMNYSSTSTVAGSSENYLNSQEKFWRNSPASPTRLKTPLLYPSSSSSSIEKTNTTPSEFLPYSAASNFFAKSSFQSPYEKNPLIQRYSANKVNSGNLGTAGILHPISPTLGNPVNLEYNLNENETFCMSSSGSPLHSAALKNVRNPRNSPIDKYGYEDIKYSDNFLTKQKQSEKKFEFSNEETVQLVLNSKFSKYESLTPTKIKTPAYKKPGVEDESNVWKLYLELGANRSLVEQWTDNIRIWLSKIVKDHSEWFKKMEETLGKDALYQAQFPQVQSEIQILQLKQQNPGFVDTTMPFGTALSSEFNKPMNGFGGTPTSSFGTFGSATSNYSPSIISNFGTPNTNNNNSVNNLGFRNIISPFDKNNINSFDTAKSPNNPNIITNQSNQSDHSFILTQRIKLELLLSDFGNYREYAINRIKELSEGLCLKEFNWNSGSSTWKDQKWTTVWPTDSFIICALFCRYLDSKIISSEPAHIYDGFTCQYLTSVPKKTHLALYEKSRNPPHYNLIYNGQERPILRGPNNLFSAICLFLLILKRDKSGHIGQYNLDSLDLLNVVS